MFPYLLRQLNIFKAMNRKIRQQKETIDALNEALKIPSPIAMGDHLLIDVGESYRVFKYHSEIPKDEPLSPTQVQGLVSQKVISHER